MSLLELFKKKGVEIPDLKTDVHSHLLPGIDDGSKSMEESLLLIRQFKKLGYTKLITTPHILQDYYPNTEEGIEEKLVEVRNALLKEDIIMQLETAAEYYLDEYLMEKVEKGQKLLTFGENYLLFEMSFVSESPFLKDFIFKMKSKGITPILAHAERYSYYLNKISSISDIIERGALVQLNINSLSGYYGKPIQHLGEKLIKEGLIHLLGSDCHNIHHLEALIVSKKSNYYRKALHLQLLNYSL